MAAMWIFVALLALGVGIGAWALMRGADGGRAQSILAERLARGDLSPDDYRERLALIGGGGAHAPRLLIPMAVVLVVLGLVGAVAAAGIAMGRGEMGWMMGGRMGGMGAMMRGMDGMMMGGESGRDADAPRSGAPELRVQGDEFSFDPDTIRITAGETVNLVFENRGRMFHTFTISSLDFELRAAPRDDIAGALRAPRAGRYTAVCTVPGHLEAGMQAKVIVEEAGD